MLSALSLIIGVPENGREFLGKGKANRKAMFCILQNYAKRLCFDATRGTRCNVNITIRQGEPSNNDNYYKKLILLQY